MISRNNRLFSNRLTRSSCLAVDQLRLLWIPSAASDLRKDVAQYQRSLLTTPEHEARLINVGKIVKGIPQRVPEKLVDDALKGAICIASRMAGASLIHAISSFVS